jgi:hypothetical protein
VQRSNTARTVRKESYCFLNLVVGRKILWYFKLKILRGLPLAIQICIEPQMACVASQPFQAQPLLIALIAYNMQYNFTTYNEIEKTVFQKPQ